MKTYKTKDGKQSGFVVGFGAIVNGQIEVPDDAVIENANLELVQNQPAQSPQPTPQASNPPTAQPIQVKQETN